MIKFNIIGKRTLKTKPDFSVYYRYNFQLYKILGDAVSFAPNDFQGG